ncbi:uncharacterized protein PAC_10158 [Phialocephala subalpina]|uniref:Rhodopsin domain-containing protein n=1 Tax=Phialocephala subalpina TaxID=576137 RepID=A0A1L7X5G6_9HELO|nr:uncharacterized protein PAC_10158 [Phialocephala subalpina]
MDRPQPDDLPPNAYENRAGMTVAIISACLFVSTVVVSLRFYVRLVIIRKFGVDDWALAVVLVTTMGAAILMAVTTKFGLGGHFYLLSIPEKSKFLKLVWFASMGYGFAVMLMKATVLLQYRRLFPLPKFQRLCNIFLAGVGTWAVAGALGTILICLPIERNWDALAPTGCSERIYFWEAYAILHIITDVLILVMPLPLLKTLPLTTVQKGVLMVVFSLGAFTTTISVIRITTLRASLIGTDTTWTMSTTALWSTAEVSCAIVCVCIPTLRPLVAQRTRSSEVNKLKESKKSRGGLRRPQLYDTDNLETQVVTHSLASEDIESQSNGIKVLLSTKL